MNFAGQRKRLVSAGGRDAGDKIRSMVLTTVIHAFIPFFWIAFAVFI